MSAPLGVVSNDASDDDRMSRVSHDAHTRHEVVDEGGESSQPSEAEADDDLATRRVEAERGEAWRTRRAELAEADDQHRRPLALPPLPALACALGRAAAPTSLVERLDDAGPGPPQVAGEERRQHPPHDAARRVRTAKDQDLDTRAAEPIEQARASFVHVDARATAGTAPLRALEIGVGEGRHVLLERDDAGGDQRAAYVLVVDLARARSVEVWSWWKLAHW